MGGGSWGNEDGELSKDAQTLIFSNTVFRQNSTHFIYQQLHQMTTRDVVYETCNSGKRKQRLIVLSFVLVLRNLIKYSNIL